MSLNKPYIYICAYVCVCVNNTELLNTYKKVY
jgi:hypothetical protein